MVMEGVRHLRGDVYMCVSVRCRQHCCNKSRDFIKGKVATTGCGSILWVLSTIRALPLHLSCAGPLILSLPSSLSSNSSLAFTLHVSLLLPIPL